MTIIISVSTPTAAATVSTVDISDPPDDIPDGYKVEITSISEPTPNSDVQYEIVSATGEVIYSGYVSDLPGAGDIAFCDVDTNGKISAGDYFFINNTYAGGGNQLKLKYVPTNQYMLTITISGAGKYAIIVGISDYKVVSDLEYCDEDATEWYNFFHIPGLSMLGLWGREYI